MNFSTENLTLIIALVTVILTMMSAILFYIYRKSNIQLRDRYDFEKKLASIEYKRDYLEHKMYELSRQLEESDKRWRDVNHLLISSQSHPASPAKSQGYLMENPFLKSFGITDTGKIETDPKLIFVLTPFNRNHRGTFGAIKDVCEVMNLKCIRGDEEYIPDEIFPVILRQIVRARIIIANITGRNPNVMYELGIAHALGKPTIIISKNFTELPFDLGNKRILIYENEKDLFEKLRRSLTDLMVSLNG